MADEDTMDEQIDDNSNEDEDAGDGKSTSYGSLVNKLESNLKYLYKLKKFFNGTIAFYERILDEIDAGYEPDADDLDLYEDMISLFGNKDRGLIRDQNEIIADIKSVLGI